MGDRGKLFNGRQFTAGVILWAVRWYLQFPISYRDLELMLQDRRVSVDHTTIFRWIQVTRGTGEADPASSTNEQRFVARGRNLCKDQGSLDLSVSSGR
jgi:IS6 family transposase